MAARHSRRPGRSAPRPGALHHQALENQAGGVLPQPAVHLREGRIRALRQSEEM